MGSKNRRAARIDNNQNDIVRELRKIPGVTVEIDHDDILVGYKKRTYWFEIKNPEKISKRTGEILESAIRESQKTIRNRFTGHYSIITSLNDILNQIGIKNETRCD